jgi:hypothetical protein
MQPVRKACLLAVTTLSFLSFAEFSPAGVRADQVSLDDSGYADEQTTNPFSPGRTPQRSANACLTPNHVMENFILDIENVGGEIIIMTDGIQQEFSDSWRDLLAADRVEVALVLAHLIPDDGRDPIVDVVEIGSNGCALTWTLLTATEWSGLVELAHSIEV